MNLNKQRGDVIHDILLNHIDEATSVQDVNKLLQITPLDSIKSFLKNRVINLGNQINQSSNTNNNGYNNPQCSSQYNEMRRLAISISSITDILPNDIMKHIISFLTFRRHNFCDSNTTKYYQFLPTLSKQFLSIMNDAYFFDVKYPLYIYDNAVQKVRKSKNAENPIYDPTTVHISVNHKNGTLCKLEVMHLPVMKFKSTQTLNRIPKLSPSNIFQSSLPWKNRHKIVITSKSKKRYFSEQNANKNIVNVLNEMTDVKYLKIEMSKSIDSVRIHMYPTFQNVIFLCLQDMT
eukprot:281021_1